MNGSIVSSGSDVTPTDAKVDSLDWKDLAAGEITRRVTEKVQPGSIVLFHNAAKHTPEALPGILETLISQGYSLLPISQLILPGQCDQDYTIDHTGRQLPAVSAETPAEAPVKSPIETPVKSPAETPVKNPAETPVAS